jgi:hypothetical protein
MVGAMCVRREQEVPPTDAQHQNEYEGEPWVVFDTTTDDHAELERETGKEFTATMDATVRAKATGGGTRESTVRTGRRSGDTPPNQTGNEEEIDPVLLNPSEEEKHAWLSEVHNPFVGHMGFHRTMKNMKRKGHIWYKMGTDVHRFIDECPYCQKFDQRENHDVIAKPFV